MGERKEKRRERGGGGRLRHTHKLCTLVSIAILPGLMEFGFPGNPYGIAKETLLVSENCSLKSSYKKRSQQNPQTHFTKIRKEGRGWGKFLQCTPAIG